VALELYDTMAREEREFVPREEGKASIYVCGPTVYADAHIGHGRAAVVFDLLRRFLTWQGLQVTFVSNITDVDDKIILRATREKRTPAAVATEYTHAWNRSMERIGVLPPSIQPFATGHLL
jgi:cysteinyl-tRNA synthetase